MRVFVSKTCDELKALAQETGQVFLGIPRDKNVIMWGDRELSISPEFAEQIRGRGYTKKRAVREYLHELWYPFTSYDEANAYFAAQYKPGGEAPGTGAGTGAGTGTEGGDEGSGTVDGASGGANHGACTSIAKGKLFGRNLDWYYSDLAEFIVHTPRIGGHFETLGTSGNMPGLTEDFVKSEQASEKYRLLPYILADGINEKGLACSMNVAPSLGVTRTTGTNPGKPDMCGLMIVRYILDNHSNALAAVDDIAANFNVYMPHGSIDEELHFLVSDGKRAFILEFVNNRAVILSHTDGAAWITNFVENGTSKNPDGSIDYTSVYKYGQGLERWNIVAGEIDGIDTMDDMEALLEQLYFTRAYSEQTSPVWKTEFAGVRGLEVTYPDESYASVIADARARYAVRDRSEWTDPTKNTWHTTHSVMYDLETLTMLIKVQEGNAGRLAQIEDLAALVDGSINDAGLERTGAGHLKVIFTKNNGTVIEAEIPVATTVSDGLMSKKDKAAIGNAIHSTQGIRYADHHRLVFFRTDGSSFTLDLPAAGMTSLGSIRGGIMSANDKVTIDKLIKFESADDTPTNDLFAHAVSLIQESQTDYITFLPVSTMGMRGAMYQYMGEWRIITENVQLSDFDDYGALFEWADAHSEPIATGGSAGSRRDLYIAAGATYDATTGHYSLNGLTDIAEEQMAAIYFDTYRKCGGHDMSFAYFGTKARTNFHPRNGHWGPDHMICVGMFQQSDIEKAYLSIVDAYTDILRSFFPVVDNAQQMFYNCTELVKVNGPLLIEEASSLGGMFYNCDKLEDVEIIGLSSELEIESPVLTFKSLRDMVTYASDSISEAIDVTVDVDIWDLLNGGHAPHDGHTTEEWQEINTDALEKNIRFVYQ